MKGHMKGRMKGAHEGAQPAFSIFFQWLGVYLYVTGDYFSYRKRMWHQCGKVIFATRGKVVFRNRGKVVFDNRG